MIPVRIAKILDERLSVVTQGHQVLTTLEGENPGGSIKDHIVLGELETLLSSGALKPGDWLAEISAGSTALSLAHYCRQLGLKCCLFVPLALPELAKKNLLDLGAQLHLVEPEGAFDKYEEFIGARGIFKFDQFHKHHLQGFYQPLMRAVESQYSLDCVIGSVGTGHSLLGVAQSSENRLSVYSAEPDREKAVSGIRNVRLEHFGAQDPCKPSSFRRIEVGETDFFPYSRLDTDQGCIEISDSFRVVLGALDIRFKNEEPRSIFAIGAKNFRAA